MSRMVAALRTRATGGRGPDEGSALVAAVAVAIIVVALSTVVVTQAIVASQDAGRDRVRTLEVHGAEGMVDALYAELELNTPCQWPNSGVQVVNTAPNTTDVSATVTYYNAAGAQLTCTNGVLSALPARAVIRATARPTGGTAVGIPPVRVVESQVIMTPHVTPAYGAAVFSATGTQVTNTSITNPTSPDNPADVWIDSGNVDCNSGGRVNGRLLVPQGGATFSNDCQVSGDVWVRDNFVINQAPSNGMYSVTGSVTSSNGNATLANGVKIGGDLTIRGSITTWGTPAPRIDGATRTNVTNIAPLSPVGLPEVLYRPSDWTGFTVEDYPTWIKWNADGASGSASAHTPAATWSNFRKTASTANQCGQLSRYDYGIGGPLVSRTTPKIYNAWACGVIQMREMDIVLYSDVAIFAQGFNLTNTMNIRSGDGQPHKLWLLVPDQNANGVAQCTGGTQAINISVTVTTQSPASVFLYTPCDLNMSNNLTVRGQVYGRQTELKNNVIINYVPMGIPGVIGLDGSSTTADYYTIDIVYKRETSA